MDRTENWQIGRFDKTKEYHEKALAITMETCDRVKKKQDFMETLEMYFIEKFEILNFRQESISWNITEDLPWKLKYS